MGAAAFLHNNVYPVLPVWAQNAGLSLYGLAYRAERLGGDFHSEASAFHERDSWSAERLHVHLCHSLRERVRTAFDSVPYYRDLWRKLGLHRDDLSRFTPADLPLLPITPKDAVRNNPEAFIPSGPFRPHRLLKYFTSGSSGTPITCYYSSQSHRRFFAAREARSFGWAAASIRDSRATFSGRMIIPPNRNVPPFYRLNYSESQIYFSAFHITPANAASYVEGFNRHRPQVLTGYCSCYYFLGQLMLAQGLKLTYRPKVLIVGSDRVTAPVRSVLESAFHAPVFEEYGSIENVVLATECAHGNLHVSPDFGILEIVNDEGGPAESGRVIATGLLNDAHYLIRYALGDLAQWAVNRSCPCNRPQFPILAEITGRVEDALLTRDGRRVVRLHGVFYNIPHLIAAQIVQESLDLIRVRVLAEDAFSSAEADLIRQRLAAERLGNLTVLVERVTDLERTSRGKVRAVINRMQQ